MRLVRVPRGRALGPTPERQVVGRPLALLLRIVAEGEKILYTCQHGDTADEMFRDLSNVFEPEWRNENVPPFN